MSEGTIITTTSEITLITLQNCPSDITYLADFFQKVAGLGVNVDMISLAPAHGAITSLSFTIADNDLVKILNFTSKLREETGIKTIVSSGNSKIAVYDAKMKNTPGVAAKVFQAAAKVNTDLRIISTSDVEIAILVTAADYNDTLESIEAAMQE